MSTQQGLFYEWKFSSTTRPRVFHSDTVNFPLRTEALRGEAEENLGEIMATTNTLACGKHEERRKQNFLNEKVLSAHVPHADTRTTLSRLLPLLVGENEENHLRWFNTTQAGKIEVTVKEWTAVNLLWNIHRTFCYYKRGETLTFFRSTQWNMLTLRFAVCSSIRESQNLK